MATFLLLCLGLCLLPWTHAQFSVTLSDGSPVLGHRLTSHSGRGIRAFTNIPYAEPPVGSLRFADPQPKRPWTSADALPPGNASILCPQRDVFFHGDALLGQEDCLYLNVYAPLHPRSPAPLPVLFFIYGGGFAAGNGAASLYGPEFLLDEDVLLVAGNYRVGALGFLSTLSADLPGNWGLKDQALMLRWVQAHVARFGGDPGRVTIFGESAGAASVGLHLLSPQSRGLFRGAILQSGTPDAPWAQLNRTATLAMAEHLLRVLGCAGGDLACLRAKEARAFVEGADGLLALGQHPLMQFHPVREEHSSRPFYTERERRQPTAGEGVQVLLGSVANEGAFVAAMTQALGLEAELERRFDDVWNTVACMFDRFPEETRREKGALLRRHYFQGGPLNLTQGAGRFVDAFSDLMFLAGVERFVERRLATRRGDTFAFKFNYRGRYSYTDLLLRERATGEQLGVSHIDDLLYLFPVLQNALGQDVMTAEDHEMRRQMVRLWTTFARTGNPSTEDLEWRPVTQFPVEYLRIGNCNRDQCPAGEELLTAMETGFFEESLEFLRQEFFV